MPEGPEVKTIAVSLNKSLQGLKIQAISVNEKSRYHKQWKGFSEVKFPLIVISVECKGKHIFFRLKPTTQKDLFLHSHLGMEGKWVWSKKGHSGIEIVLSNKKTLYYDDSRHFGHLDWMDDTQYQNKIKNIGIDLLSESISLETWTKIFRNKRLSPKKQVCEMLITQKYFSGIGNYLKSEILYRSKIKPDRVLNNLKDEEIEKLLLVSIRTIKESYESNGLTIKSYIDPNGNKGTFKLLVYGKRKGKDSNGYNIITSTFKDARTTFWVKEIQV